ncbi:MAG: hypothetical protein L6R35_005972 [Caloplaca aegaea]|nr:MAG: hypothetical protein L6R35_005972 [Caloplaca aegaea]
MSLIDNTYYNELPSLETAHTRRQGKHIDSLIQGPLRDIFIKYDAHKAFALYLQHRHHRLDKNETMVKVHGTAHLMNDGDIVDIEAMGNKILPATWMGRDMLAMEFAIAPASVITPVVPPKFIAELDHVLTLSDCKGLFGIDTLAEDDWTELTIGDASVVVPSNGKEGEEKYIPVAFAFDDRKSGFRVHGKCGKDHKHTSKPRRDGDI